MKYFILMVQFFTTIPIRVNIAIDEDQFSKGLLYFPFVGLIIGLFNYLVYYISLFLDGELFSVTLWLVANIIITGALHIDGLADTCDGLLSYRSKERILEIMKDSRIGTNGVIAIFLDLLMKLSIMLSLSVAIRPYIIILSPVIGRGFLLVLFLISPYARKAGTGGLFYNNKSQLRIALGILFAIFMLVLIHSWKILLIMIPCLLIMLIFNRLVSGRIGGMTGDTLGAANELIEVSFLLFVLISERLGYL